MVTDNYPVPCLKWWIKDLSLYDADKEVLLENKELTDNIINAAQSLMKAQFPGFAGLQNTLLGINISFKPVSRTMKSIQILHTGEY